MRILIVAGGTGGHIYPAAAIVKKLKKQNPEHQILWIGGKRKLEQKLVPQKEVKFQKIAACPFPSVFSLKIATFFVHLFLSFCQAMRYIFRFRPRVVVTMGSFHSFPVGLAAFFLGKPLILCEQNVYLSLTNRMLLPFASRIALSFPDSFNHLPFWAKKKAVITGNPVREEIIETSRKKAIEKLGLEEGKFTFLFMGGSQGADFLNQVACETLRLLEKEDKRFQFIIITGDRNYSRVKEKTDRLKLKGKVFPYLYQIDLAYAASDLVICRSGATTLAEITARGLPAILIPYPFATHNHQMKNALCMEKKGAARVIPQEKLTPSFLKGLIKKLAEDENLLSQMREKSKSKQNKQAASAIANLILHYGRSEV